MKFIIVLFTIVIAGFFGLDAFLSTRMSPSTDEQKSGELVKNMASFLEQNPKIAQTMTAPEPTDSTKPSSIDRTFGNTVSDQYFSNYLDKRLSLKDQNFEEQTRLFVQMGDYIQEHPRESVESLESALLNTPSDQTEKRQILETAFIHAAIHFIETEVENDATKKSYFDRFINTLNNSEVREALESHFPELAK